MSRSRETIATSVLRAIAAFNAAEDRVVAADDVTLLLGDGGALDSLGLVRLIMTIERQLEDDLGVPVSLTDEKAMSQRNSPFRSVGTLISYLVELLGDPR